MTVHKAPGHRSSLKRLAQTQLLILSITLMVVGNYLAFRVPSYEEYQGIVVIGTIILLYQTIALVQGLAGSKP